MTARDFSTRPVASPGLRDRGLAAAAAVAFVIAVAISWKARTDVAEAAQAVAEARRDPALRRTASRGGPRDAIAAQALATLEAPPARVLGELASLMPPDVRLDSAILGYGDGVALDLRVVARDGAAYDRFLEGLAASPRFTEILPGAETRGGAVSAPLRMRYRAEPVS